MQKAGPRRTPRATEADGGPRVVAPLAMDDLVTERLVLHPMSPAEAERLVAGEPGSEHLWAPGYPCDVDVTGARHYLEHVAAAGDPRPFGTYEIRRREDGLAIGGCGYNRPPDQDGTTTIGYGLIPSVRGRGYAAEALRELLRFARECGIRTVRGDADRGNIPSQRVMTAAGMRYTGEDDRVRYYEITWDDEENPAP